MALFLRVQHKQIRTCMFYVVEDKDQLKSGISDMDIKC